MEEKKFREVFDFFDKNKDGTISIKELKEVMIALGNDPTDSEVQELMEFADTNGNGKIEFEEYLALMRMKL